MPIPRNNLIHDQDMDEIRSFISRVGYDPRLPPPLVNPIDMPQQPQNHPQQPQNHPRHPHNIRDPPTINNGGKTRRNNGGKTRRNNGGKTRKRKSRKNKNK